MKRLVMLLILGLVASSAVAQPKQPVNRREQIKKRIRILRSATLTEELALDEGTATKLFPLLAKYDDELDKLLQQKVELGRKLEAAAGSDPKSIDRVIDDAMANQKALWASEERRLAELRKILTPAQVARLLVVLPALERKIQNQLRKAIENANRPAEEPDDNVQPDERRKRPQPAIQAPGCDPFAKNCR